MKSLAARGSFGDQSEEVLTENFSFIVRRQSQQTDLCELDTRMEPRSIGSEQHLSRPRSPDGLLEQVEAADARRVGVNIRMLDELIDEGDLCPPVVGEAPEVRNDEPHMRIFGRDQLDRRHFPHRVV